MLYYSLQHMVQSSDIGICSLDTSNEIQQPKSSVMEPEHTGSYVYV